MPIRTRLRSARPDDLLAIHLRDHLAAAVGGLALLRRATGTASSGQLASDLARLEHEVASDLLDLRRCTEALGIARPRLREAAAVGAERLGRLKVNGQLLGTSPLSPVVELEALLLEVTMRVQLWRTLAASEAGRAVPADVDLGRLESRAVGQRRQLERLHHETVVSLWGAAATGTRPGVGPVAAGVG